MVSLRILWRHLLGFRVVGVGVESDGSAAADRAVRASEKAFADGARHVHVTIADTTWTVQAR